jgi:hypothetical protein
MRYTPVRHTPVRYTLTLLLAPEKRRPKGISLFIDETAIEIDKDMPF